MVWWYVRSCFNDEAVFVGEPSDLVAQRVLVDAVMDGEEILPFAAHRLGSSFHRVVFDGLGTARAIRPLLRTLWLRYDCPFCYFAGGLRPFARSSGPVRVPCVVRCWRARWLRSSMS